MNIKSLYFNYYFISGSIKEKSSNKSGYTRLLRRGVSLNSATLPDAVDEPATAVSWNFQNNKD